MEEKKLEQMYDNVNLLVERQSSIKVAVDDLKSRGCNKREEDTSRMTEIEGNIKVLGDKSATNRALLWIVLTAIVTGLIANFVIPKMNSSVRAETNMERDINRDIHGDLVKKVK